MHNLIRLTGLLAVLAPLAGGLQAQSPKARFTLTGGPQAGIYEASGAYMCETFDSDAEDHGFGADFLADPPHGWRKGPALPVAPLARNAEDAEPEADAVALSVTCTKWGTPETEIVYPVFTIPRVLDDTPELARTQTGKGRATVTRAGDQLSASFSGETADGVRMEGSVECR
jgi:hypothetical protein